MPDCFGLIGISLFLFIWEFITLDSWLSASSYRGINTSAPKEFSKGDRVFHGKFGIGHIEEIKQIGSSKMYVIDFGKQGKKAVDSLYSNLKKFWRR